MKRLISFSGAQSTGKSTLLNQCANQLNPHRYYPEQFEMVPEITRTLNKQFGVSINQHCSGFTQTLILSKHVENYLNYINGNNSVIMDRCIWDGLVYTKYLESKGFINGKHFVDLAYHLFDQIIGSISVVFYTDPTDVKLTDDGVRSLDISFRNDIIELFNETKYLVQLKTNLIMLSGSVEERMNTINNTLFKA